MSPVVLEAVCLSRTPHCDELLLSRQSRRAGSEQASELDVATPTGLLEEQDRRHPLPLRRVLTPGEDVPQQGVPLSLSVVKLVSWLLVVAVVGEVARLGVDRVRPVGICSRRIEHDQPDVLTLNAAVVAEPSLVAHREEYCDRVIASVVLASACVLSL